MPQILTINGGSSSIKFAVYEGDPKLRRILSGKLEQIGSAGAKFSFTDASGKQPGPKLHGRDRSMAARSLIAWLETRLDFDGLAGIGHRVVHGLHHTEPQRVNQSLLRQLRSFRVFDPEHLPGEIQLMDALRKRHPRVPQVACFDTSFHRHMPQVAKMLPIPRRYFSAGLQRYGFHGISYSYLMEELKRLRDPAARRGRVILAHLGNGASMAAVLDGKSIDTSMSFTPTAGLVMGTRSGDLDPGVSRYLARTEKISPEKFYAMANQESGLLGISGISSDMSKLLAREKHEPRAAEAVAAFCYQASKWLGSFTAALNGLDTLVFAGGIGENAAPVRARICQSFQHLGLQIDAKCNGRNRPVISTSKSSVMVRVIPTDEEQMIARSVCRVLGKSAAT